MPEILEKDFQEVLKKYREERDVYARDFSFDFCQIFFLEEKENVLKKVDIACYILWSFLGSWGMLRGSSKLSKCNPSCLKGTIEALMQDPLYDIDIKDYSKEDTVNRIIKAYNAIKESLSPYFEEEEPTMTLITKILLGVFSCIPAFDVNFSEFYRATFNSKASKINEEVLRNLYRFASGLKGIPINMIGFDGEKSKYTYNKARMLDIYGWTKGAEIILENKNKKANKK